MEGVSASLNEVELKELCDKCIITERSGVDTASDLHVTSHMPGPSDPVTGTSCCGTGHGGHVTGRGGHVTGKSCCGTGHGGHVTDLMLEDGVLTPSSKPSEVSITQSARTPSQYGSINYLSVHGSSEEVGRERKE